jgi:hypothetical protein
MFHWQAVLEPHTDSILATSEMGECIELLQVLGRRTEEGAFVEAVDRILTRSLSQQASRINFHKPVSFSQHIIPALRLQHPPSSPI